MNTVYQKFYAFYVYPEATQLVRTNAHPRVEVILQNYIRNIPENLLETESEGMVLHLVNLTGFSGNTYFDPLPMYNIEFTIMADFEPSKIWGMVNNEPIDFAWDKGELKFSVKRLDQYEGIVIEK